LRQALQRNRSGEAEADEDVSPLVNGTGYSVFVVARDRRCFWPGRDRRPREFRARRWGCLLCWQSAAILSSHAEAHIDQKMFNLYIPRKEPLQVEMFGAWIERKYASPAGGM